MRQTILILTILSLFLAACAPAQPAQKTEQPLAEKLAEKDLLVTPESMSIGIAEGFQNIMVTYKNSGTAVQSSVEPKITRCTDKSGSAVNFIILSSKPRNVYGEQTEVYQLTISSTREAKFGTYSCTMGVSINGQSQSSPTAAFTVTIRQ